MLFSRFLGADYVPLLLDPPFVLFLFLLGASLGSWLLKILRVPLESSYPLERMILSTAIGTATLQFLPYSLGMCNILTPPNLLIALLIISVLFSRSMFQIVKQGAQYLKAYPRKRPPVYAMISGVFLIVLFVFAFFKALSPPIDPDGLGYQLTAPKRWLQSGQLNYLPSLTHTNHPMGFNMLYLLTMGIWSDTATKLIHFGFGTLAFLGLYALGKRLKNASVGFIGASLWLVGVHSASPIHYFAWAYVDLGTSALVCCAFLSWLLWRRTNRRQWLLCAALSAGLATSFKLTTGLLGVVLLLALALEARWERKATLKLSGLILPILALVILPVLPWLARTWLQTGNPVYPMLPTLFPTRDWDIQTGAMFDTYFKFYNWNQISFADLSLPQRVLIRNLSAAIVVLCMMFTMWRTKNLDYRLLSFMIWSLLFFTIMTTGLYLRFFLPLLGLLLILALSAFGDRLNNNHWLQGGFVLLLFLRSALIVRHDLPLMPTYVRLSINHIRRERFLMSFDINNIWDFINKQAPKDAKIASEPGPHGASYYCDRYTFALEPYVQRRIRTDHWNHYLADYRRDNIGYLVTLNAVWQTAGADSSERRKQKDYAQKMATLYGKPLLIKGNYTLYELDETKMEQDLPR